MSDANNKASTQDQVIQDYLQSLMQEDGTGLTQDKTLKPEIIIQKSNNITEPVQEVVQKVEEIKPVVVGIEQLVAEISEVITQTVVEVSSKSKTEDIGEVKVETVEDLAVDSGVPEWAESRFQCLLFKVSGLSLAVPLVKLNSVIPWDEAITETPNQTDWYLGLVQHLQNQVKVIDTALLVMPENRRQNLENEVDKRLSHILLVDDYKWGLACSSIGDVIWMNQDEVKWRKSKTSRAWLSGTSLEHLCAIMDTEVFAKMLPD